MVSFFLLLSFRYMAEILSIQSKTPHNQSINQSFVNSLLITIFGFYEWYRGVCPSDRLPLLAIVTVLHGVRLDPLRAAAVAPLGDDVAY